MKRVIDFSIFRDYDIRGTYPDQINEEIFCLLGKAISSYLKVDKIAVGRDARLSSLNLFSSLIRGILETGTDVVDLGMISTEMHYFASGYFQFPAKIARCQPGRPAPTVGPRRSCDVPGTSEE